jgi:hypothetical protein
MVLTVYFHGLRLTGGKALPLFAASDHFRRVDPICHPEEYGKSAGDLDRGEGRAPLQTVSRGI